MKTTRAEVIHRFEKRQIVVATLGLLILMGLAVVFNSFNMLSVAKQTTQFVSHLVQNEDFREVSLTLETARLNSFQTIKYESHRLGRSFSLPAISSLETKPSFWKHLFVEQYAVPVNNPLQAGEPDIILYEATRLRLIPYAILAWFILVLVSIPQTRLMKRKLVEQFEKDMDFEKAQIQTELAKQVRHNLRTPLAALMRLPSRLPESSRFEREILSSSIAQMRAITSALDDTTPASVSSDESKHIYDSITRSVREISLAVPTRIKFSYDIDDNLVSALIPHIPHELRALLGNIVNNSVDSISSEGVVKLAANDMGAEVQITIEDSGRGIPTEILDSIFDKGFSFNKAKGSGIGLFHAKTWITQWGGRIVAQSPSGQGTKVTISLPIQDRTPWYIPRLKFSPDDIIVILDDQLSARYAWKIRLDEYPELKNIHSFGSRAEAEEFMAFNTFQPEKMHYLFDYEIGDAVNGLDLLSGFSQNSHRYLVTGHFDEPEIRERCAAIGVYLLPKSEIANIPIVVS